MKKLLKNEGIKVSIITIIINFVLFLFKLIAGLIGNSNAMISDSIHSLSDVLTTIVVIFGLIIASKEADDGHPYGHERIECVFAIILSFFLLLTGVYIGYIGIDSIIKSNSNIIVPTILPLIAALVSIVVKEFMYHYTKRCARKLNSSSMEADAWHHRSDAMSSVGSFIGILGAKLGYPILDPICSVIICIIIIKSAIEIFVGAISQMLDTSCDIETKNEIIDLIKSSKEIVDITDMKTRMFGSKIYIEVEVSVDGDIPLREADKIINEIHDNIENKYSSVKHCNIHVIPN